MKAHKQDDTPTRLALLEQSHDNINITLSDIRYQIHSLTTEIKSEFRDLKKDINDRFDKVEQKFNIVDQRFQRMEGKIYQVMFLISSSVMGYIFAKIYHFI